VDVSEVDFLIGQVVEELRYPANGLRVVFDAGDNVCPAPYLDLEQAFTLTLASGEACEADPAAPTSLGVVLDLAGAIVETVSTEEAVLTLTFRDGRVLRCEPHPASEAWQVCGGTPQFLVVCSQRGGGLEVYDINTPALDLDNRAALPPQIREIVNLLLPETEQTPGDG
jgi:hypothetical protein